MKSLTEPVHLLAERSLGAMEILFYLLNIIIFTAHHSIADGLSLNFLLGDLLRAVIEQKRVGSQETENVERLMEREHGSRSTPAPAALEADPAKRQPTTS